MDRSSNEGGFRVNQVLKGAREGDSPFSYPHPPSMKSMTVVNRAQLTPLKSDQRDKARQELTFEMMAEKRNGKGQKLNPIGGFDSKKQLWYNKVDSICISNNSTKLWSLTIVVMEVSPCLNTWLSGLIDSSK